MARGVINEIVLMNTLYIINFVYSVGWWMTVMLKDVFIFYIKKYFAVFVVGK